MSRFAGIITSERIKQNANYKIKIENAIQSMNPFGMDNNTSQIKTVCITEKPTFHCLVGGLGQILYNEDKSLVLLYDGVIDNYSQLFETLIRKGHHFSTENSGEVILHMYEEDRDAFETSLKGMFSFCLFDINNEKILLSRDCFGGKPLYYIKTDKELLFASELKGILSAMDKVPPIDGRGLELYFTFRFIPAPYTIIEGIRKIESGTTLEYSNGEMYFKRYHKQNTEYYGTDLIQLREEFVEGINSICRSKEDIGCFLSGGMDSSLILSIAMAQNKGIHAYTVGYDMPFRHDETSNAKRIAKSIGVEHQVDLVSSDNLKQLLNKAVYYLDEPFFSTVSISTLKLSEMAKGNSANILVGDGSDELFFGYQYLYYAMQQQNFSQSIQSYFKSLGWLDNDRKRELLNGIRFLTDDEFYHLMFNGLEMKSIPETLRRVEIYKRLPDYHLMRVDRMTSACGIEAIAPFLESRFVELVLGIPKADIFCQADPKAFLKSLFSSYVSDDMKCSIKQPFTAPIQFWVENVFWDDIQQLFHEYRLLNLCGLEPRMVDNILNNYRRHQNQINEIWGLYMLLKWVNTVYTHF